MEQKCQSGALTVLRRAAELPTALPAPGEAAITAQADTGLSKWPGIVLAGISGLELCSAENNRCTILEALKVLVADLHPCLVYCCTGGIR